MIEKTTDFPFLGRRDYIHGTSIMSGFLDALEEAGSGPATLKRLKFVRLSRSNGRLVLATGALDAAMMEHASCTLSATVGDTEWRGALLEEGRAVEKRIEIDYAIEALQADGFGGTCVISAKDREELVRALVEANKRFHEAAFAGAHGLTVRFGYAENWKAPPRDVVLDAVPLTATNLITRKTAGGCLTINRLSYAAGDGAPASLDLCFEAHSGSAR